MGIWSFAEPVPDTTVPEASRGWEPITADGFGNELRYDLATGTLELPTPAVWNDGTLCVFPQRHPANIYRHHAGNETAQLKRRDARIWTARFHLVRALRQHWNDARQIGMLMTETLGIPWQEKTSEPRAARLIAYAYEIHEQTCRDLTDLLKVAPQVLQRAA